MVWCLFLRLLLFSSFSVGARVGILRRRFCQILGQMTMFSFHFPPSVLVSFFLLMLILVLVFPPFFCVFSILSPSVFFVAFFLNPHKFPSFLFIFSGCLVFAVFCSALANLHFLRCPFPARFTFVFGLLIFGVFSAYFTFCFWPF